jgi:hypothetical protein
VREKAAGRGVPSGTYRSLASEEKGFIASR